MKRRQLVYYLKLYDEESGELVGNVVDITTRGCKIISEEPLPAGNPFEKLDDVGVAHANATVRTGYADRFIVGTAMDIDVPAQGVAIPSPVETGFTPGEPEYPAENPVPARLDSRKFIGIDFAREAAAGEDCICRATLSDDATHAMPDRNH